MRPASVPAGREWLTAVECAVSRCSPGSRIVHVPIDDGDVVLRPPPPLVRVVDVAAAVRDALRFPLAGARLLRARAGEAVASRSSSSRLRSRCPARRSIPGGGARDGARRAHRTRRDRRPPDDPRRRRPLPEARPARPRAAAAASGGTRVPRSRGRPRRGSEPDLVPSRSRTTPMRASIVRSSRRISCVVVSAAETILHGGPGALLAACDADDRSTRGRRELAPAGSGRAGVGARARRSSAQSLEASRLIERLARARPSAPHGPIPRTTRTSRTRSPRLGSPFRRLYSLLPGGVRRTILPRSGQGDSPRPPPSQGRPRSRTAEALLRAVELRGGADWPSRSTRSSSGVPWIGPHVPREPLNPITSAAMALGLALRLWRDAFPVREGGTLVLVHSLTRSFAHGAAGSVPAALRRARNARTHPRRLASRSAPRRRTRARRRLPSRPHLPPAPPVRRLGRLRPGALARSAASSSRAAATPAPRARSASSRATAISSALEMAHGVSGGRRASASCSRRPTRRSWSAPAASSLAEVGLAHLLVRLAARRPVPRARSRPVSQHVAAARRRRAP